MTRKTYAVYGLMEWQAIIPIGNTAMTVLFTGGHLSSRGISPARYTTADPLTQLAIEESEYFRRGRIKLVKVSGESPSVEASNKGEEKGATRKGDASQQLKEVEVSCLEDAAEYLKEHHGVSRSKTTSKGAIEKAALTHGIIFKGL